MGITVKNPTTLEEAREVILQYQEAERTLEQANTGLTEEQKKLKERETELQERNQALFLKLQTAPQETQREEEQPKSIEDIALSLCDVVNK